MDIFLVLIFLDLFSFGVYHFGSTRNSFQASEKLLAILRPFQDPSTQPPIKFPALFIFLNQNGRWREGQTSHGFTFRFFWGKLNYRNYIFIIVLYLGRIIYDLAGLL